ncbi:DUF58 domain-containing protein [Deltaproteobacteria bacterium Smac51]|nr:DUF58 domain-containing protein [Deltaproteobacteria bacterium Smac51]
MTRPTRKAACLFALSVPLALLIVTVRPGGWYGALYYPAFVLAFIGADFVMALSGRRLLSEAAVPPRLYVGLKDEVRLTLTAEAYDRPLPVETLLELKGDAEEPRPSFGYISEGPLEMGLPLAPLRRGRLTVLALWLRWRGPLGLVEYRQRRPLDKTIEVVPDLKGIHEAALQFFARDAAFGIKTQRLKGEGTEFDNITDYAPGMDNRLIDWKRSARHRKLLAKEFRQERNHQVVLGFDTGHLMLEPIDGMPRLDHAIRAGLILSWISLHNGDLVGGAGFDAGFRSYLKPGRGMPWFTQFQRFTSGLDYQTEETNFTLGLAELNSRLKRRALVVLFTEFIDTISAELLLESLQLMARRHLVIFVTLSDPFLTRTRNAPPEDFTAVAEAVIADTFLRDRAIVLERAARLGIHCLDVPAREMSASLLNRYLMIKQRGLL